MEQMVEAQHYTPEGRGFDWNLSLTSSFRPHFDPKVDSASNRNENQEYLSGGGIRWPVRRADNLTTFLCRLS